MTTLGLQLALAELGFDPGPADGKAGPLTQMAIERFQRAYRLHFDLGQVGPATLRLLRTELPKCRQVVSVTEPCSLSALAAHAGTTPEALIEANRHKAHTRVHQGENLIVYRRAAMRVLGTAEHEQTDGSEPAWSRILVPMGRITCDGELELEPCPRGLEPWRRAHGRVDGLLELAAPVRVKRAELARRILIAAGSWAQAPLGGVVLRGAGLDLEGAVSFAQAAAALARAVSQKGLRFDVGAWVQLPDAGRTIDLEELSDVVDWVVAELPAGAATPVGAPAAAAGTAPFAPTDATWELLREATRFVPRWKLVAGIDLRPVYIEDDVRSVLSWQQLAALRKRHVMREAIDDGTGTRQFTYRAKGRIRRVFAEDRGSLARVLHYVNSLNMLGVAFVGMPPESSWVVEEMRKKFIPM